MIRVNVSEQFLITVAIIDDTTGDMASGEIVHYEIRKQPSDTPLSPPANGVLPESTVEAGIYSTTYSLDDPGSYILYATCSGFTNNTENITVNEENIYELTKQNRHYNTSVEDIIRENVTPTASQISRKVGLGKTDYVITMIKPQYAADWTDPATVSGIVYAHYREIDDDVPFLIGDSGV